MTKKLGTKLQKLRVEHNYSHYDVAEKIDRHVMLVSSWERSKSRPDPESLARLAELYNIPPEELTSIIEEEQLYSDSAWGRFPYPTIITAVYLIYGFYTHNWHPAWLVLLTIPVYRRLGEYFIKR